MFSSLQRYTPLLQNYLRAEDPKQFTSSLKDPTQKQIIEALTGKIKTISDLEKAIKVGLTSPLVEALVQIKLIENLQDGSLKKDCPLFNQIIDRFSTRHFDYPRPVTLTADDPSSHKEDKIPSSITLESSLEAYISKKLKESDRFIGNLNEYTISRISEKQLFGLSLWSKDHFLNNTEGISYLKPEVAVKFLVAFQAEKRKEDKNTHYSMPKSILEKLTKEQIEHLGKGYSEIWHNQGYVDIWFTLHYMERINKYLTKEGYLTKQELDEKRKDYLNIIEDLSHKPQHIIRAYCDKLRAQVFILDIKVNDTSIQRLIDHLQKSASAANCSNFTPKFSEEKMRKVKDDEFFRYSNNIAIPNEMYDYGADPIQNYLIKLFRACSDNKQNIYKLSPYFKQKYLREINIKTSLSKGIIPENVNEYLDTKALQQLRDKKQITLHNTNQKKYRVCDKVQLEASLKNVKEVHIKVYELSLQKHNLLSNGSIDDEINLSFLKPTFEEIYQHKPINEYAVEQVVIPIKLEPKMGVFIVDLQGQTVTSRAVIRKGTILCLEECTEAGQKFSFYNEEGKALTPAQGLKVWIKDRLIDLKERNYCITDYLQKNEDVKIIASVGNYSQIFNRTLLKEVYEFKVGYIYNSESFLVGKKAKIILHGRLAMRQTAMSLELLKDIKVKVTVTNHQKISSFFQFSFDKWTDSQDLTIEFPIQSYTNIIDVEVGAKIKLQSQKDIDVNHSKAIMIDLGSNNEIGFVDFYLEKDKHSNYILNTMGLNGQPMTNHDITINYLVRGINEENRIVLKTDNAGKIHLGPLNIVDKLEAQLNNSGRRSSRLWSINEVESNYVYCENMWIKAGQSIVLPAHPSWNAKDIVFFRRYEQFKIENLSQKITLKNGKISLPVLNTIGFYQLSLLPVNVRIVIEVVQNKGWEGDSNENLKVLTDEGFLYDIRKNPYESLCIHDVKVDHQPNQNKAKIELNLEDLPAQKRENVRVHVFATNYCDSISGDVFKEKDFIREPLMNVERISIQDSTFYSNKKLSDEGAYVWNRQKKEETLVGNNLEKPGIFLKRKLVRQTKQQDEDLSDQDNYVDECQVMSHNECARLGKFSKKAMEKGCVRRAPEIKLGLSSHNNFLLFSGYLSSNLQGNVLEVIVPQNYSHLQIYLLTPTTAIRKSFSLGSVQQKKLKDLRHEGIVETSADKAWTMSREVYALKVGELAKVNRSSQWRTIGLKDMFQFAKAKGFSLYDWSHHLLSWNSYSLEQKKAIFDKECCHQLNSFIKLKDPEFFSQVVEKHISNKIQKTFVDYCLLEDIKAVSEYTEINKLSTLNPFQQALLVMTLKKESKEAAMIVEKMENQEKAKKQNYNTFKNNFDTVINSKLTQQNKEKRSEESAVLFSRSAMGDLQQQRYSAERSMAMAERQYRMDKKKPFIPVQSTKEYTERTYYTVTNYKKQAPSLFSPSLFWAELARHLFNGHRDFLSKEFMNFSQGIEFILAACFVSSDSSSNFDLSNSEHTFEIKAKSPMLLYVKEIKEQDYLNKFGVQINQRFLDPSNMYTFEDGLRVEREVEQFVVKRPYICQTVVTNTSGTPLELQILLDIPKGTIPLLQNQYTDIVNITLNSFTSKQFKRYFYAPEEGVYPLYPSNACRGSIIIAKCPAKNTITVKKYLTINKLQSFDDILRSGNRKQILKFIQTKNIFDQNEFDPTAILWMLKEKQFYLQVIESLRARKFFSKDIWNFGFLHWDLSAIKDILIRQVQTDILEPAVFEYFPYYSTRTHQFANEAKSTIRNVQFKESYMKFLVSSVVNLKTESSFLATFAYYLLLQDRFRETQELLSILQKKYPKQHTIQVDYMQCFLDMSLNTHNFPKARQIVLKYKDYPVQSWAKLFKEVSKTLEAEDEDFVDTAQDTKREEFVTQVIQEAQSFKIIQPAETTIQVEIFEINLELFFSEFPFGQNSNFTSVRPSLIIPYQGGKETKEIVIKRSDYPNIKDATIEIIEFRQGVPPKKISTFSWSNPDVRVKVNENSGTLQVFLNKKKQPGAYIKVFSNKNYSKPFYRDGYTDMTGTFRYAMSDLDEINMFSILVLTQRGGQILKVKPPSKLASY